MAFIRPITPKSDWSYNHLPLYNISYLFQITDINSQFQEYRRRDGSGTAVHRRTFFECRVAAAEQGRNRREKYPIRSELHRRTSSRTLQNSSNVRLI